MKKFRFGKKDKKISAGKKSSTNKKLNREHSKNEVSNKKSLKQKLKTTVSNIEIKPKFLIIGLIAIITVISLIYFIFLKYSPIMNFKYEGYAVSGKEITENLLGAGQGNNKTETKADKGEETTKKGTSQEKENNTGKINIKNVDLVKIEEQGKIFKKLDKYFVGNKEKTEINLNYPIYINDKTTIYNLNQDILLISKNFEQVAGYPNISIIDGKVYNGNSLERADEKEYIFVKTNEGIYINLKEIKIQTTANEYIVPANSLIAFEENGIRYYSIQNNILVFNEIKDVDYNSQIIIKNVESNDLDTNAQNIQNEQEIQENQNTQPVQNSENTQTTQKVDNKYNYEELLTRLGVIENEKNAVEKEDITKEDSTNDNEPKEENSTKEENEVNQNTNQDQQTNQNKDYIKPEVTVEDFKAEVYTAKSTLTIKDPKARIIEAPTFEIYKDGKIYLRRVFKNSGEIQITGLVPETEYEIIGKYIYLNAENKKVENTFYKGTIKTKGYEALGTIELSKEEGEIYSNKIQIKNVKIISDLQNEAIKGINQIELETGNIKTVLKNNKVNELLEGKEVTIESSEGLKSNTKIEYAIKFYDKNGKELKAENTQGKTRTAKQKPTVKVTTKSQDIVSVTLGLKLSNKDRVHLENYKYVITKPNGEKIKEERLSEHEKEIKLEDLDQNQYYKITVYADYDLGDNKGTKKDTEIGNLVFATKPISTLGSLELQVENKELTSKNAKISYKIDEEKTDKRLIQILNELTIKIVEEPENVQNDPNNAKTDNPNKQSKHKSKNSTKQNTAIYTHTLTKEEIEKLQQGETKEINYENLKSNTKYTIEITGNVELGNTKEEVPVTYTYKEFTTLKIPAKVEIKNQFVTGNLIDLDVIVEDENNSVLNNKVRMELRDEKSNLIDLQEIETNKDWLRKTYEKLEENKTYKLSFYADQYNEGSTDKTYKINYLIKEIEIVTEPGISGSVGLTELTKKATGKNLVDMSSEIKWYVYPNFNTNDYYGKEYNKETKILTLGGHGNYRRAVYDLREYAGQEVTMSFKAKAVSGSQIAYIQNSKKDANRTAIQGLTTEWKDYQYTLKVDSTGYLGFYIHGGNGIEVKELQIELGNKKTSYEEFKYTLQSNYSINLEDKRDEIATNDYYIKIYENNNLVQTNRYEEIPEENVITNAIKTYEVQSGRQYKVELTIKMKEREYVLSSLEYDTKETEEIKGIYNKEDFLEIQPRGNYIVLGDIDLSGGRNGENRFGNNYLQFAGKIDFNGHTLTRDFINSRDPVFYNIDKSGVIENLELNLLFNNTFAKYDMNGLFFTNNGKIRNIKLNVLESTKVANVWIQTMGSYNFGTIENFVFNFKENVYASSGISSIYRNCGVIKNGYIYGKNLQAIMTKSEDTPRNCSPLIVYNAEVGKVSNIYTLVSIDVNSKNIENSANIAIHNEGNASVSNVFSEKVGKMFNLNIGPNIAQINSKKIRNNYYFTDEVFSNEYHEKTTKLALHDANFLNQLINEESVFAVDEFVEKGYYPQLKFPECMPNQEFIKLPDVEDKDLADILSVEVIEQGTEKVKLKMIVNNPSAEQILDIKIKDINVKIINQEYNDGKSDIEVELYNPVRYVSNYSVLEITTKGAFNKPYTREFKEGERKIEVDLYKEIHTIEDWKNINKSPTENYILMQDLDFSNEGNTIEITNIYTGKLNGNNNTIKNIILSDHCLIRDFRGTLKNINIKNIKQINSKSEERCGIIYSSKNAEVENVHIIEAEMNSASENNCTAGVLIGEGYENVTIHNCSATNVKIEIASSNISNTMAVGGLVGSFNGNELKNCYVRNLNIIAKNSITQTVGGLVGKLKVGTIKNCYVAQGNIEAEKEGTGGLIGYCQTPQNTEIYNCYTTIEIKNKADYIAGIVGNNGKEDANNIKNNLSLGNMYTSKDTNKISRITVNNLKDVQNYAFEEQKINGYKVKDKLGANLLNYEELCKEKTYNEIMGWKGAYDCSKVQEGYLPKLYDTSGKKLLPNQEDIKIKNSEKIEIEKVSYEKVTNNTINILMEINNPEEKLITKIEIEDMDIKIIKNITKQGKTYIEVNATPTRYYDSYRISKIKYKEGEKEEAINISAKINVKFYKELYNYSDWQSIEEGTYQNYKLARDIDFKGKKDIKTNVRMSRLESNGCTLKNIEIVEDGDSCGLIKEITSTLSGVNFENITIEGTNGNRIGIIPNALGKVNKLRFKNITIKGRSYDKVGCIAYAEANISDIILDNVTITGKTDVGGLVGYTKNSVCNIKGNNLKVNGRKSYIGGIVGDLESVILSEISNVQLTNSVINGPYCVGGVCGWSNAKLYKITVQECEIKGSMCVGGCVGKVPWTEGIYLGFCNVLSCKIYGYDNEIGGIAGITNTRLYNLSIKKSEIIVNDPKTKDVGGILGVGSSGDCTNSVVEDNVIRTGAVGVGGLVGRGENFNCYKNYINNTAIEGYSEVGGICGHVKMGQIHENVINSKIVATNNAVGGIFGYMQNKDMLEATKIIRIYNNNVANSKIKGEAEVGGLVGNIEKKLYTSTAMKFYYNNYIHADLISNDKKKVSIGIGGNKTNNSKIENTNIYKYSTINGEYAYEVDDLFGKEQYLTSNELKLENTYRNKIGWGDGYIYTSLKNNKYPFLSGIENGEGINLPEDPENVINKNQTTNFLELEKPEQIFSYNNKAIKTYSTYSVIEEKNGSRIKRDEVKLYLKDGKLYAVPVMLNNRNDKKFNNDFDKEKVVTVANNLILDSYNGKEYTTVLGSDGKLHDLKEPLTYPKNFVNENIASIGNNLDSKDLAQSLKQETNYSDNLNSSAEGNILNAITEHEVEVMYKNGDKVRFNYQTGEVESSSKGNKQNESSNTDSKKTDLFDYIKEKISTIGNTNSGTLQRTTSKYEKSKLLQNKLEEMPVEEALQKQNSNTNKPDDVANGENNKANNSLKEKRYISIYNAEKDEYQIYQEEELLDTTKQEVVSENDKIEANNLKEYYASEGKSKNKNMGILWITLSIVGVIIILFAIKKRD